MVQQTLTKYENELQLIITKINKYSKSLYVEMMDTLDERMYFFHLDDYEYLRNTMDVILRHCEKGEYYEMCAEIVTLQNRLNKWHSKKI